MLTLGPEAGLWSWSTSGVGRPSGLRTRGGLMVTAREKKDLILFFFDNFHISYTHTYGCTLKTEETLEKQ